MGHYPYFAYLFAPPPYQPPKVKHYQRFFQGIWISSSSMLYELIKAILGYDMSPRPPNDKTLIRQQSGPKAWNNQSITSYILPIRQRYVSPYHPSKARTACYTETYKSHGLNPQIYEFLYNAYSHLLQRLFDSRAVQKLKIISQ